MLCPGSLAPHFVNNDYVTAEITHSTARARQEALDHGMLCAVQIRELHLRSGGIAAAAVPVGSATRGENIPCPPPRLLSQPGEKTASAVPVAPGVFSSFPTCTLSTTDSTSRVHRENRIGNTDEHRF